MSMEIRENQFILPIDIEEAGTVTKVLQTADKYVDKNIEISITTPSAEFELKQEGAVTATASIASNSFTSDTETPYAITAEAIGHIGTTEVGVETAGFVAASDSITIAAADSSKDTATTYIKAGHLNGSGTASATGNISLEASGTQPSGFYVKASAAGGASVDVAGWLPQGASADASGDKYYAIKGANLANVPTDGTSYDALMSPVLTENGFLYINEGYIAPTKIALATLIPDNANISSENADLVYNTVKAYDKDGALIVGTMGNASLGTITANDATATISSLSVSANPGGGFKVTGSDDITGSTSVSIAERGLAETSLSKTGEISGTASVDASLDTVGLGVNVANSTLTVTPEIKKQTATNAKSGDITTSQPASGRYVAIASDAIAASTNVTPTVTSAGYGTSAQNNATGASVTAGAASSGVYYVPITAGSHTAVASTPSVTAATATVSSAVTASAGSSVDLTAGILNSAPSTGGYLKIDASATTTDGSVSGTVTCTASEGYIETGAETKSISGNVSVSVSDANSKYIRIYDGSFI